MININNNISFYIGGSLLLIVLVYFTFYGNETPLNEGFRPFSYLGEDISQGNCLSRSGEPTVYIRKDKVFDSQPKHVYFGSPNPLLHQMKPMSPPCDSMFYFANYKCSPECCPSPYSCSSGCVCIGAKNIYKCNYNSPIEKELSGPNSF